jgi:hypothetical protein
MKTIAGVSIISPEGKLRCAHCGDSHLNQAAVEVWDYGRSHGVHTLCESYAVRTEPVQDTPMSEMRRAVSITFDCEQCFESSVLTIEEQGNKTQATWAARTPKGDR